MKGHSERLFSLDDLVVYGQYLDGGRGLAPRGRRAEVHDSVGLGGVVLTGDSGAVAGAQIDRQCLVRLQGRLYVEIVGHLPALPELAFPPFYPQSPAFVVDDGELLPEPIFQGKGTSICAAPDREGLVSLRQVVLNGIDGEGGF